MSRLGATKSEGIGAGALSLFWRLFLGADSDMVSWKELLGFLLGASWWRKLCIRQPSTVTFPRIVHRGIPGWWGCEERSFQPDNPKREKSPRKRTILIASNCFFITNNKVKKLVEP